MPISTLENVERVDLRVIRGDSLFKEFWLSECDDNVVLPLDFTGYSFVAEIRRSPTSSVVTSPAVTLADAANAEINISLTTTQTLVLRPGQYVWTLRAAAVSDPEENTYTLIHGLVDVLDRGDLGSGSDSKCCPNPVL